MAWWSLVHEHEEVRGNIIQVCEEQATIQIHKVQKNPHSLEHLREYWKPGDSVIVSRDIHGIIEHLRNRLTHYTEENTRLRKQLEDLRTQHQIFITVDEHYKKGGR